MAVSLYTVGLYVYHPDSQSDSRRLVSSRHLRTDCLRRARSASYVKAPAAGNHTSGGPCVGMQDHSGPLLADRLLRRAVAGAQPDEGCTIHAHQCKLDLPCCSGFALIMIPARMHARCCMRCAARECCRNCTGSRCNIVWLFVLFSSAANVSAEFQNSTTHSCIF